MDLAFQALLVNLRAEGPVVPLDEGMVGRRVLSGNQAASTANNAARTFIARLLPVLWTFRALQRSRRNSISAAARRRAVPGVCRDDRAGAGAAPSSEASPRVCMVARRHRSADGEWKQALRAILRPMSWAVHSNEADKPQAHAAGK
jgi:hypothetical protein